MKLLNYCWLTLLLFSSHVFSGINELSDTHLSICGDSIDWEPYTYVQDEEVKGFDLDVLNEILPKQRITFDFTMSSWSRCLKGGRAGDFQLAVSATYSDQRAQDFLYTTWYYATTPSYLYKKSKFKDGLKITQGSDLNAYKVCGIHGYNYSDFGLKKIHQNAHSMHQLVEELNEEKCDVILAWKEIVAGIKSIWGIDYIGKNLAIEVVPKMPKHKFHMMISKKYKYKEQLKELLDQGLKKYQTESF